MHSEKKKNRFEIDMCNGSIMNKLISFSIPLMISGILQLALLWWEDSVEVSHWQQSDQPQH